MFHRQYNLKITSNAPVFIGSGKQYGTRDYIFSDNGIDRACYFFDQEKLYRLFAEHGLTGDYEAYMLDDRQHQNQSLDDWLQAMRKTQSAGSQQVAAPIGAGIGKANLEKLQALRASLGGDSLGSPATQGDLQQSSKQAEDGYQIVIDQLGQQELGGYQMPYSGEDKPLAIDAFIRDGRNRLYIPASSVKGALRTQIERLPIARNKTEIEKFSFYNKLSIADSGTLADKHFCVIEKLGKVRNGRPGMPLYRECLMPNKIIKLRLTIKSEEMDKLFKEVVSQGTLYIGGGAGFSEKSIDPNEAKGIIFRDNSPSEITPSAIRYKGIRYEMGKCTISIEEV